uniref:Uncharacterized protein n=1 Tax=Glossina pallidipes TaxID=7398 RepID=A0A1A9ZWN9_GLOPL
MNRKKEKTTYGKDLVIDQSVLTTLLWFYWHWHINELLTKLPNIWLLANPAFFSFKVPFLPIRWWLAYYNWKVLHFDECFLFAIALCGFDVNNLAKKIENFQLFFLFFSSVTTAAAVVSSHKERLVSDLQILVYISMRTFVRFHTAENKFEMKHFMHTKL